MTWFALHPAVSYEIAGRQFVHRQAQRHGHRLGLNTSHNIGGPARVLARQQNSGGYALGISRSSQAAEYRSSLTPQVR
jgi:hypothetical protein